LLKQFSKDVNACQLNFQVFNTDSIALPDRDLRNAFGLSQVFFEEGSPKSDEIFVDAPGAEARISVGKGGFARALQI